MISLQARASVEAQPVGLYRAQTLHIASTQFRALLPKRLSSRVIGTVDRAINATREPTVTFISSVGTYSIARFGSRDAERHLRPNENENSGCL
jgi:hypothetical protein